MAESVTGKSSAKPAYKAAPKAKMSEAAKPAPAIMITEPVKADPLPALDVALIPEPVVVAKPAADPLPAAPTPAAAVTIPETTPAATAHVAPAGIEMLKKGLSMMTDTNAFAATTEKAQAVFGDINARAKAAAEKSAKLVEEMSELTKGNVEALVASGKIAAKGAENLGAEYAAYSKASFEKATGAFKSFTSVKSPTELFQLQSEYAKSSFDALVAESSKLTETFVKLAGDVMQPLSSRFAVAAEKVKAAAL